MTKRKHTLPEIADRLRALRSALNPTTHQLVWDLLTEYASEIDRIDDELSREIAAERGIPRKAKP